jgi:hypothetical protein
MTRRLRPTLPIALVATGLVLASSTATATVSGEPATLERQWAIAAGSAVKIDVSKDGWYRVSRARLRRLGASLTSPSSLRLYADGTEIPMLIDRRGIEFYGEGADTASTDTRTYWLVRGPAGGLRIPVVGAQTERRSGFAHSFQFTEEREFRTLYSTVQNGDRQNYFSEVIFSQPRTFVLKARDVAGRRGVLEVTAQGLSRKDHRIAVALNGRAVGTMAFGPLDYASHKFTLPSGVLHAGANSLTLTSLGGDTDASFIDTTRLTYLRRYRAEGGSLRFSLPAGVAGRVTGFRRPDVTLIDVTHPSSPRLLRPSVRPWQGAFAVFMAPAQRARKLVAVTTPAKPAATARNRPSHWHESGGADVVIIGYRSFLPQLARLVAYHERQGLKVALVDVQDLYDEFTFGAHAPEAIKDFLARARAEWHPAPRYVLLGGDATSDPRNYLHQPARDFVPTKTVDTQYMETASDDWFADFDNDGVPEMAVGRLPIRTQAEAAVVVDKIIGYEQGPAPTSHQALLVSDTGFEPATASLSRFLPSAMSAVRVNRSDGPTDAAVRGRILDVLDRGPSVVNYYGHGAVDIWTGAGLLESADAAALKNAGRLSLFVMMTCLNGYFIDPQRPGLAEALLRAPYGGAFAVWASSGLTEPSDQIRANEELFRQLAATSSPRLGDAMVRAKSVIRDLDVRRTWILFGDPLTRLR